MKRIIHPSRFAKLFLGLLILFVAYHLVIWHLYTSHIFGLTDGYRVGDLVRNSYQIDFSHTRKPEFTLTKQHFNQSNWHGEQIDIITVGDSFSNGGAGDLNRYYQDHIASLYDMNILNIQGLKQYDLIFEAILVLYNNGTLEKLKPKAVLIESVNRYAIARFTKNFDFAQTQDISIFQLLEKQKNKNKTQDVLFINTANYKFPFYALKYKFKERAHKNVYKLNLGEDMFSTKIKNKLLVYHEDIAILPEIKQQHIEKLNHNFNTLAKKLNALGIQLIYMPIVDKYDLYYDVIIDNKHKKNLFFDLLRPMEKDYYMLDTKQILSELLNNKEKDIFYADDTHWSYKASEAIAKDPIFNILKGK